MRSKESPINEPGPSNSGLDSMPTACHYHAMGNLQVKNVPEALHKRLRRYANKRNTTLSDLVLDAIKRELGRLEFHDRLSRRAPCQLETSAASLLSEERQERSRELE